MIIITINGTTNVGYVRVIKKIEWKKNWMEIPGENVRMLFVHWDKGCSLSHSEEYQEKYTSQVTKH